MKLIFYRLNRFLLDLNAVLMNLNLFLLHYFIFDLSDRVLLKIGIFVSFNIFKFRLVGK